jgi:uncharacterized membrane-anchored protein YhcB (DUF1043 family)
MKKLWAIIKGYIIPIVIGLVLISFLAYWLAYGRDDDGRLSNRWEITFSALILGGVIGAIISGILSSESSHRKGIQNGRDGVLGYYKDHLDKHDKDIVSCLFCSVENLQDELNKESHNLGMLPPDKRNYEHFYEIQNKILETFNELTAGRHQLL